MSTMKGVNHENSVPSDGILASFLFAFQPLPHYNVMVESANVNRALFVAIPTPLVESANVNRLLIVAIPTPLVESTNGNMVAIPTPPRGYTNSLHSVVRGDTRWGFPDHFTAVRLTNTPPILESLRVSFCSHNKLK